MLLQAIRSFSWTSVLATIGLVLLTLQTNDLQAQAFYQKTFSGPQIDEAHAVVQTNDCGFAVAGITDSYGAGGRDWMLLKLDPFGDLEWSRTIGGTGDEDGNSVGLTHTSNGGFVMVGGTKSFGATNFDIYVVRLQSDGTIDWELRIPGSGSDVARSVIEASDGSIVIAGTQHTITQGSSEGFVMRISATGTILWGTAIGDVESDHFSDIVETPDGGFALVGSTASFGVANNRGGYLVKVDGNGNIVWDKVYDYFQENELIGMELTADSGFVLCGYIKEPGSQDRDIVLLATDSLGNLLWNRRFLGGTTEEAQEVIRTPDGGFMIAGNRGPAGAATTDVLLIKVDANGGFDFGRSYGQQPGQWFDPWAKCLVNTADGGLMLAGNSDGYGTTNNGVYLVKIDSNGSTGCWSYSAFQTWDSLTYTVFDPTSQVGSGFLGGTAGAVSSTFTPFDSLICIINTFDDEFICSGDTLTLVPPLVNTMNLWQDGSTGPTFDALFTGTYWVEMTTPTCTTSDTLFVTVDSTLASIDLGPDTAICAGDTLTLLGPSGTHTFLWHDNSTDTSFSTTQPGTYWLEISESICVESDTIEVSIASFNLDLGPDTNICDLDTFPLQALTGGSAYLWQDSSTNELFQVQETGQYSVTVTAAGCEYRDTVLVNAFAVPQPDLGNDTSICDGTNLSLQAPIGGPYNYLWQDGSSLDTLAVGSSGLYTVEVSIGGCSLSDSVIVVRDQLPVFDLGENVSICVGDTYTIIGPTGMDAYLWDDGSTDSNLTIVNSDGGFNLTVTKGVCSFSDAVFITEIPLPPVNLGDDVDLCDGLSVVLGINAPGANFEWQDGSTESELTVTESGVYSVTVTVTGCSNSDDILVDFLPLPTIDLGNDTLLCDTTLWQLDAGDLQESISWEDGSNNRLRTITESGTYNVTVSRGGCSASDSIALEFAETPVFSVSPDTSVCQNSSVWIEATGDLPDLVWSTGSSAPALSVSEPGVYYARVSDVCGVVEDSVLVAAEDCQCYLYIPNAFTPNADRLNDGFRPVYECQFQEYKFTIYDRWGKRIFSSSDPMESWDGQADGQLAPSGVYTYRLVYISYSGIENVLIDRISVVRPDF